MISEDKQMKTITIPKRFGYPTLDIMVNGKVYTVKSGEEITVEDNIAEAIENAIASHMEASLPNGNGGASVNVIWTLAEGGGTSSMTFDEIIEALGSRGAEDLNIVITSEVSGRVSKLCPAHVSVSGTEIYAIAFEGSSSALKRWHGKINSAGGRTVQWSGKTVTLS